MKATRARYTLEFKLEAVRLVKAGQQSMAATAKILGIAEQTLHNSGSVRIETVAWLALQASL